MVVQSSPTPGRQTTGTKQKPLTCERLAAFSRAGNGTRTRDPNLGKVVLYQLSYSRDRNEKYSEASRAQAESVDRVPDGVREQTGECCVAAVGDGSALVVELLGRSNGVGFEIGAAFQLFDVTRLLAYSLPFVALMLAIETFVVQPIERRVSRWRPRHA